MIIAQADSFDTFVKLQQWFDGLQSSVFQLFSHYFLEDHSSELFSNGVVSNTIFLMIFGRINHIKHFVLPERTEESVQWVNFNASKYFLTARHCAVMFSKNLQHLYIFKKSFNPPLY